MTGLTLLIDFFRAGAAGLLGFAAGVAYFAQLRWTVAGLAARRGWSRPVALTLGRLAVAAAAFAIAAGLGAFVQLPAWAGFLVARARALRLSRKAV
jgi:hypothetical protein